MSPQAVRVRTSSGWQDIALVGPQGPQGLTPSARAHSAGFAITADTAGRFLNPPLTVDFNDFGGTPFVASNSFTAPAKGRYLIGLRMNELAPGNAALAQCKNQATVNGRSTSAVTTGQDGTKGGIENWDIWDLNAGDTIIPWGYSSGGGSTNVMTFEVIRLDAAGATALMAPVLAGIPGSVARLIPEQTIAFPTNDGSGKSDGTIPLGFTWSTHIAFIIVKCWPLAHWAFYIKGGGWPVSNSQGGIILNNTPAQNFLVTAISIGIP